LLLALPSGVLPSLQTTTAAFAQPSSSSSLAQDIIDETATSVQDSSSDDIVLEDSNEFGDEGATVDQDNTEDQDAANVGLQDQDGIQEQDSAQDAANRNVDVDVQEGVQREQPPPPPTEPPEEPPGPPGPPGPPPPPPDGEEPPPPPEEDTTPPTLTVPEDIVFEATSAEGAQVTFTVTAEDNVGGTATLDENNMLIQDNIGGSIIISCDPPSGSTFPIGETIVQCTATDEAGNTATASFTVTVQDTTPPTLTVPEDMTVEATSPDGAVVSFEVRAHDNVDGTAILDENNMLHQDDVGGSITIVCDPPSGSTFPLGETEVHCRATDEAGNTATASFTVTVVIGCKGVPATIVGTPGDDNLVGTDGRDVIALLEGNDRVDALGGDDLICADEGDDRPTGGTGDDEMFGGDGEDAFMLGGDDNDEMFGGDDNDSMLGQAGNDIMLGQAGNDFVGGNEGDDDLSGGDGDDSVSGEDGDDELSGGLSKLTSIQKSKINYKIKKKLQIFEKVELPLLLRAGFEPGLISLSVENGKEDCHSFDPGSKFGLKKPNGHPGPGAFSPSFSNNEA
jgi:Ca2+-binding RTX toxin-like protein